MDDGDFPSLDQPCEESNGEIDEVDEVSFVIWNGMAWLEFMTSTTVYCTSQKDSKWNLQPNSILRRSEGPAGRGRLISASPYPSLAAMRSCRAGWLLRLEALNLSPSTSSISTITSLCSGLDWAGTKLSPPSSSLTDTVAADVACQNDISDKPLRWSAECSAMLLDSTSVCGETVT